MRLFYSSIRKLWKKEAPKYWWGDPVDVRFHLCKKLRRLQNKRILDIGCNVGIILNCADNSNIKEGYDLDEQAIELAKMIKEKQRSESTFHVQNVFQAKITPSSVDVVVFANMVEMFSKKESQKILDDIATLLRPGGLLLLTTPNGNNSYYAGRKLACADVEKLLSKKYSFSSYGWNPFPIHLGHIFQYVPGWISFLEYLMLRKVGKKRAVALYIEAVKK